MRALKLSIICTFLLLVAFSSGALAKTDPLSKANRLPPSLEEKVQLFKQALEENGYEVARGYWDLWTAEDCKYSLHSVGFCYGNNPTAPYAMAFVPAWKDEFVDKSMHHELSQPRRNMYPNYRLGEREALVVLAELPPPARYLGYQTYVSTRKTELNTEDPIYKKLISGTDPDLADLQQIIFGFSPNPDRMMMLASIGDAINNVVIDDQSIDDQSEKTSWNQQRFFVTTPDEDMAEAMIDALYEAGVESKYVFTEKVSPRLVHLGYGPEADDFFTVIRYAMPEDPTLGEQWREQLPLTVLRVRDKSGDEGIEPFEIPEYEEKKAAFDENELLNDLNNLVTAVKEYWGQTSDDNSALFRSVYLAFDLVGQHCLEYSGLPDYGYYQDPDRGPMNCIGDGQDADYRLSAGTYHLDDGQVIAVVGTLGTKTENATYTSLSVNWFPVLAGVLNRDDTVLEESAKKFKDALSDSSLYTKFYVYYFARDCSGLYPYCKEVSRKMVPKGEAIKIAQRNYVTPGTNRAPNPNWILSPVAIEFDGSKRPPM